MMSVKAIILAPIWGAALVTLWISTQVIGPSVDEQFFPVLADQRVSAVARTPTKVCWDWTYTKMRDVRYVQSAFIVERDDGVRFPVTQWRADLGIPTNDSTTARKGVRRTIPECVSMPSALSDEKHVVVRGRHTYRSWLWPIEQVVAPVDVDMLPGGLE